MKKVGIKVLKPFSYRGKMRKAGETFGVNQQFANAMILLGKAEKFVKAPKPAPKAAAKPVGDDSKPEAKRTYNTRRATPTKTAEVKAEELKTVDVKAGENEVKSEEVKEKAND